MDILVQRAKLLSIAEGIFIAKKVPIDDARVVADVLVEANMRGHDSHGVIRIPKWVLGLAAGAINPIADLKTIKETRAAAMLEASGGLGPAIGMKASDMVIRKAKEVGIGIVAVRKASHLGMLGYYTEYMAKTGVIGICMTNTEAGVAPFGTCEKVLGTNPLSIGVPSRELPIVLDMSTSTVARGKIVVAMERGEPIPVGWALDAHGEPTCDPVRALEGVLLPAGGIKGSGLAIMVDLLTGALAGASVGKDVKGTFDMKNEGTKGDMFMAIDPSAFAGMEEFLDNVDNLGKQIKGARKAKGAEQILLPGEYEYSTRERRSTEGIPLSESLHNTLVNLLDNG